jgi:uncharacterized RmlC-like cupin family protein
MTTTTSTPGPATTGERGIRVIKAAEATGQTAQTAGIRRHELVAQPGVWIGVGATPPGVASDWHHHGDHDTYIYLLAGQGRMEFGPGGREACEAATGDLIVVPKGVVHREVNPGTVESAALVVRVGTGEVVVNVAAPA